MLALLQLTLSMEVQPSEAKGIINAAGGRKPSKGSLIKLALIFFLLLTIPIIWRWTTLNEWINLDTVIDWQQSIRNHPAAFYLVIGVYVLGSLALFPVTILNVATVFTFGPLLGNVYALVGWLISAAMGYGIGRAIGRQMVQKLTRSWLDRIIQRADRHGFFTVLTMRVFPVAPFTLVNVFVGASGIRFRDFFLASLIGRIPGIILLSLAGIQIENILRRPDAMSTILLMFTLLLIPPAISWLWKRVLLERQRQRQPSTS